MSDAHGQVPVDPATHEANLDNLEAMLSGNAQPSEEGEPGIEAEEPGPTDSLVEAEAPEPEGEVDAPDEEEEELTDGDEESPAEEAVVEAYEVVIDGEKHDVPLEQLIQSFSFQGMNTQRRMADADTHRDAMALVTERERVLSEKLETVEQFLAQGGDELDYEQIKDLPPEQQRTAIEQWSQRRRMRDQVQSERAQLEESLAKQNERALQQHLEQEGRTLVSAIPEWADESVMQRDLNEIGVWAARHIGFNDQELQAIGQDSKSVIALRYAKAGYDAEQGVATVRRKVKRAKTMKPGQPTSGKGPTQSVSSKQLTRLRERIGEGDLGAAQQYMDAQLPGFWD